MNKVLLLDMSAIMYKSHFAMSKLKTSTGFFTGAILGFVTQLEIALKEIEPTHIGATFDVKRSTLERTQLFADYKKKRKEMPTELREQIPIIEEILDAYKIKRFSKEMHEADDVIASLTEFAKKNNSIVHILTGDKDLEQLVSDDENVVIHLLGKDFSVKNRADVKEHLKIYPEQIPDFFGLKGDSADGIPGVFGIGDSNGIPLIEEFSTLENIYNNLDKIKDSIRNKLIKDKEQAFLCRELAYVKKDIDFNISMEDIEIKEKDISKLKNIYVSYELRKLLSSIEAHDEKENIAYENVSFNTLISHISKAKDVSFYCDDKYISANIEDNIYIVKNESENTLFNTEQIDFTLLPKNVNYILYDAKKYMHLGLDLKDNFFDILIASYVLNTQAKLELEELYAFYFSKQLPSYDKKEQKKLNLEEIEKIDKLRVTTIVSSLTKIKDILESKLSKYDPENTYEKIEKPLISVLYSMEKNGIKIDKNKFKDLENEFIALVENSKDKIQKLAGEEFNLDSPKQLGNILFEKMNLPIIKKSKTGYSTDVSVLEELAERDIEIAKEMLDYRFYRKLLSTYLEPIPKFADEKSRVHSVFNGTGTATGRLSSNNPNLQNIPARTVEGTKIRSCFIADEGMSLVSFDYSQIELRVLAKLSEDENLLSAYKDDLDLHELTARKLFLKPSGEITKLERNIAKTINFSVLYGKTPYGLSKELKIPIEDAKKYIDTYFKGYPKVAPFLNEILQNAIKNGYVTTLFGTRRYIHDVKSDNKLIFEQGKRMAINTVVQGTAANIIKMVMIKLHKLGYKMLIQVHDELIFELPKEKANELAKEIKEIMENTIDFEIVKLKVNLSIGDNWGELK